MSFLTESKMARQAGDGNVADQAAVDQIAQAETKRFGSIETTSRMIP